RGPAAVPGVGRAPELPAPAAGRRLRGGRWGGAVAGRFGRGRVRMGTWAARWRAALRIAWRGARRNKGRTALVVTLIALPLLAGTAMITAVRSAMPDAVAMIRPSVA